MNFILLKGDRMLAGEDKVCPHHSSAGAVANLTHIPQFHHGGAKDEERQSGMNSKKPMTLFTGFL